MFCIPKSVLFRRGWLFGIAFASALLTASFIAGLEHWANRHRLADTLLWRTESLAQQLDALEWKSQAEGGVSAEVIMERRALLRQITATLAQVRALTPHEATAQRVDASLSLYKRLVDRESVDLVAQRFPEARAFEEHVVDPAFEQFLSQLQQASGAAPHDAEQGSLLVELGSILILSIMALTMAALFQQIEHVRRTHNATELAATAERYTLATRARCILWRAEVYQCPREGDRIDFEWRPLEIDSSAAQSVVPLDVPEDGCYWTTFHSAIQFHDWDRMEATARSAFLSGRDSYDQEFCITDRHGSVRWLHEVVSIEPVGPRRWHAVGVCTDVTERRQAELAVEHSERRLRALVESLDEIAFEFDADGVYVNIWTHDESLLAQPKAALLGRKVTEVLGKAIGRPFVEAFRRVAASGRAESMEYSLDVAQGICWFLARLSPIEAEGDAGRTVCMLSRDITERKRMEAAVQRSEEHFRSLVQNASDVIAILDRDGTVRYVSPAAERVWGCVPDEVMGRPISERVHLLDRARLGALLDRVVAEPHSTLTAELRFGNPDGTPRVGEIVLCARLDEPDVEGIVLTCRDITERKVHEEALVHQAFHDPLTGLPNRALYMERLRHALDRADRRKNPIAVVFLDLDGFKVINDSLGHEMGDRLLVAVGERLQESVRIGDTVARLGGDEFTLLLEDLDDARAVHDVADRIVERLAEPIVQDGREVFATASLGIALSGLEARTPEDLLRGADTALYRAKRDGKARWVLFDSSMEARALERLELETDLRRALERDQLRVHYQPIVHLESGRVTGAEALLRWEHPRRGLVLPSEFVPIAEETGLIMPIGRWVLETACRRAQGWRESLPEAAAFSVNVNLSARQLQSDALVAEVAAVLQATGLEPRWLRLEITENVLMTDLPAIRETLHQLRALGIRLAIDDFGTGYSSMAYLSELPIDTLKIDRSFVQKIRAPGKTWPEVTSEAEREDDAILRMMIGLAKTLELEVTGEGIETGGQWERLRKLACDHGQGFYLGRPVPGEGLEALLADGSGIAPPACGEPQSSR